MSPHPNLMEPPYSVYVVEADASLSTHFLPITPDILPPLLSNGFNFFQASALCPSPSSSLITPFNMDTPSPSRATPPSLTEPAESQGHCDMASNTSALSLTRPDADFSPSSPSTTSSDELPDFQTDDELRARLDQYIRSARWFQDDEHEPTVGAKGVPKWAVHLAEHGRSVYECFVNTAREQGSIIYKCSSHGCKFKSTRLRRVVGHQRKKRKHTPFVCKAHPDCTFRGHTIDNITDHCSSRNAPVNCGQCGARVVKKNMQRHLNVVHS